MLYLLPFDGSNGDENANQCSIYMNTAYHVLSLYVRVLWPNAPLLPCFKFLYRLILQNKKFSFLPRLKDFNFNNHHL